MLLTIFLAVVFCAAMAMMLISCVAFIQDNHSFGYNRKEQLTRIMTLPFAALLTASVCTLF